MNEEFLLSVGLPMARYFAFAGLLITLYRMGFVVWARWRLGRGLGWQLFMNLPEYVVILALAGFYAQVLYLEPRAGPAGLVEAVFLNLLYGSYWFLSALRGDRRLEDLKTDDVDSWGDRS